MKCKGQVWFVALVAFAMSASAFVDSAADNRFGFDAQGRVTAISNAINKVTAFAYDANGNLVQRTDARGQTTAYQYSSMNRLTNVVHQGAWKAAFSYDANGNNVAQASPLATNAFSYDSMNRLASSLIRVYSCSFVVTNSYDLNGNRTNIVYPGGLSVGYSYDAENRLSGITTKYTNDTKMFLLGYDGASRLTSLVYPNGVHSTFGYDAESRVTNYTHGSFIDRKILRNALGFKTTELIDAGIRPEPPVARRRQKIYNDADQLVSEQVTQGTNQYTVGYGYNENGCLTNLQSAISNSSGTTTTASPP